MTLTKRTASTEAITEKFDFNTFDKKGRRIGCMITIWEDTFEITSGNSGFVCAPGTYFTFRQWATRDGEAYGAIQHNKLYATATERSEAIEKYLKSARKRAEKNASK